jgi:hypothetical protein
VSLERFISATLVPMTQDMDAIAPMRAATGRPALEGNLTDLELPELLRLLGSTRQTGTLQVLAGGPVLVTLVDGAVSYATDDPSRTLHEVLGEAGMLHEGCWERATAPDAPEELGDALVAAGLDAGDVSRVLRRTVLDVVTDLSLAPQGRFRFVPGRRHSLGDRFHYPVPELVRDLEVRLEEWHAIRDDVPSFEHRAALAPALPADRANVVISASDWRVMVAISAAPTLEAARGALGVTRFVLARSVAALVRARAVELHPSA